MLVLALNEFVQRCRYSLESPEGCCALQVLGLGFLVGEKAPSSWGGASSWRLLGSFGSKGTVGHDCLLVFYLGFSVAFRGRGGRSFFYYARFRLLFLSLIVWCFISVVHCFS